MSSYKSSRIGFYSNIDAKHMKDSIFPKTFKNFQSIKKKAKENINYTSKSFHRPPSKKKVPKKSVKRDNSEFKVAKT